MPHRLIRRLAVFCLTLLAGSPVAFANGLERGSLLAPPRLTASLSAAELVERLKASDKMRLLLALAGTPRCGVAFHALHFATIGGAGEATDATGVLMVPQGSASECQGPRPALGYAHATSTTRKDFDLADPDVSASTTEATLLAALFAGQGYLVVASNYAGYHRSSLAYHPYLNAEQQSGEMVDVLVAAAGSLTAVGAEFSGRLLLAGYSQGAHVAMATQRRLQAMGVPLTAAAFMSGPYALAAFGDALFYGWASVGTTLFVPLIVASYQQAYGDLYVQASDYYAPRYAASVPGLLPGDRGVSELFASGALPRALFSDQPPLPEWASITPPTDLPPYAASAAASFGADALLGNALRRAYLQDFFAQPDGLVGGPPWAGPAEAPGHPLRRALKRNDLRNFTPTSPVLLCGGHADTTVYYDLNTRVMEAYWSPPSPTAMAPGLLSVLDVDASPSFGDPYRSIKQQFGLLKGLAKLTVGDDDLMAGYHGALVPPFCLLAARQFFQQRMGR